MLTVTCVDVSFLGGAVREIKCCMAAPVLPGVLASQDFSVYSVATNTFQCNSSKGIWIFFFKVPNFSSP